MPVDTVAFGEYIPDDSPPVDTSDDLDVGVSDETSGTGTEMGDDVAVIGAILYGELGLACQVIGSAHQATHTLQVVGLAGFFPGILTHLVILDGSPVLTVLDIALHKCGNQTARRPEGLLMSPYLTQ